MDPFYSYPWDFTAWLRRSAAGAANAGQSSARRITLMFTDGSRVADALAAALSRVSVVLLLVQQPHARPVSARQQRRLKSQRIGFFSASSRNEREVRDVFDRAVTRYGIPSLVVSVQEAGTKPLALMSMHEIDCLTEQTAAVSLNAMDCMISGRGGTIVHVNHEAGSTSTLPAVAVRTRTSDVATGLPPAAGVKGVTISQVEACLPRSTGWFGRKGRTARTHLVATIMAEVERAS